MSRDKLIGQVVEITGGAKEDRAIQAIVGTFQALNDLADFEREASERPTPELKQEPTLSAQKPLSTHGIPMIANTDNVELRVGYTINLNLPETNDPEVFNAIFKALRDNLLKN